MRSVGAVVLGDRAARHWPAQLPGAHDRGRLDVHGAWRRRRRRGRRRDRCGKRRGERRRERQLSVFGGRSTRQQRIGCLGLRDQVVAHGLRRQGGSVGAARDRDDAEREAALAVGSGRTVRRCGMDTDCNRQRQQRQDGEMGGRTCSGSLVGRAARWPPMIGQYRRSRGFFWFRPCPTALPLPALAQYHRPEVVREDRSSAAKKRSTLPRYFQRRAVASGTLPSVVAWRPRPGLVKRKRVPRRSRRAARSGAVAG